jgi:hypothetical protein
LKKSVHRTVEELPFDEEVVAVLSILYLEYDSGMMAKFLLKNLEIFLFLSNELAQLLIAYKLEDFTQKE